MTKPVLLKIKEFREVLNNYSMSEHGKSVLARANLLAIDGPTAGGRNTIIGELVKTGRYMHIISDTTRPKRMNDGIEEQDGLQYWFRGEQRVLDDLRAGEYIEAAIIHNQQVSGTPIREIEDALNHDKISVLDIQYNGVDSVISEKSDTCVVWVTPPSFEEWITRLRKRGSMSDEEFHNRISSARVEYQHSLDNPYYKHVINDNYLLATERIRRIVETGDYTEDENERAKKISALVLERITKELG